jgi:hypothetical protein
VFYGFRSGEKNVGEEEHHGNHACSNPHEAFHRAFLWSSHRLGRWFARGRGGEFRLPVLICLLGFPVAIAASEVFLKALLGVILLLATVRIVKP